MAASERSGVGPAMTKKRKVCSPSQEGQSDICAELKQFIVQENAKCVKEIKDSNDKRLSALEESLSFAMDSIAVVSDRQRSTDIDIVELQRETADLRRRLQQIELDEDRRQQEKRLVCLVFSGQSLQAQTRREDAAQLIRSLVQQYLRHTLDSSQVKAMIRLRNGKVLVEFTSSSPGSDRDVLFKSKSKLRGSGLYIAESLTPRRQAIFSDLLRLKKDGKIFSVFTRSGDILACRSRDSAPIRVASCEAVRSLSGDDAPRGPAQGRARAPGGEAPPEPAREREERRRTREAGESTPSRLNGGMEVETRSPVDSPGPAHRGSYSGPRRVGAADRAETSSPVDRDRRGSSLLDCARESAVQLVQLSPPLQETPAGACAAGVSATADGGLTGAPSVGARGRPAPPAGRPDAAQPPLAGGLEPPLTVTSDAAHQPVTAPASGRRGEWREHAVSGQSPAPPSGGRPRRLAGSQPDEDGAGGGECRPEVSLGGSGCGVGGRSSGGMGGTAPTLAGRTRSSSAVSRPGPAGAGTTGDSFRSRDIRDYF